MLNNNKSKFIFSLILFSNLLFSQTSENIVTKILYDSTYKININSQLPPFIGIFKIFELQNGETNSSLYDLRLINSIDNSLFYALKDTIIDFTYWPEFEFEDVNFDGFLDFWTIIDRDVKAQPSYHFWTFNPPTNTFKINQEFSDSLVCNQDINPSDSTISSGCSGGCMGHCGSERIYKVINNRFSFNRSIRY